jgi:hypothetical protein
MIKPTVGRAAHFHPAANDQAICKGGEQPLAAIIAHVWSDTCVNLVVFDANGHSWSRTSVLLIQDDGPIPEGGYYCAWMPYQKGQAAKTEELEREARLKDHGIEAG